jgi:pimeloyl-ACP methyl ester carboxylesterase
MIRSIILFTILCSLTTLPGFAQSMQKAPSAAVAQAKPDSPEETAAPREEDWAKLPVDRRVMPLLADGLVMGKTETPAYTRELVRLQWRAADPIDLWVVKPRNVQKPRVVLYLYSFPSGIDRFRDDSWCLAATHDGLAAVGFVSALTAERFHGRPMREWFVRELQESMGSTAHDVQLIIDYFERRGDLSVDKVGMFGQGSGGAIAILAAAVDPRIQAVDLLNPWGDWPDWLKSSPVLSDSERSSYVTPEFLQKASTVEPIAYLPLLKDRALRVQQIMDYPNTPPAARDKIADAVPVAELVQYKDRAAHAEAWKTAGLTGWLANQLKLEPRVQADSTGK